MTYITRIANRRILAKYFLRSLQINYLHWKLSAIRLIFSCYATFTCAFLPMLTHPYLCLPKFTHVYSCSLVFTNVYQCLLVFIYVYQCLLGLDNLCLPMLTRV